MVIQFFVLGSLGEYLRQPSVDYIKLLIKLKKRMLLDISRDLFFNTNSNNIAHVVDKCSKHKDLDVGVDPEDVKLLINKMKKRMTEQLDELC
ncbi:hypothetical protein QTN25_003221 [Entamoeba marina]